MLLQDVRYGLRTTFGGVALLLVLVSCAASAVRLDQAAALRE